MLLLGQDLFKLAQCKWWCWNVNRDLGKSRATPLPKFCGLFSQWGLKRTVRSSLLPEKGISKEARTVNFPIPTRQETHSSLPVPSRLEQSELRAREVGCSLVGASWIRQSPIISKPGAVPASGPSQDEIGNPGCNLSCLQPQMPQVGQSQRESGVRCAPGAPQCCVLGPSFLKNSGAARRRCDWPRSGNLYANEAAQPPRRPRPVELAGEEGT